MDRILRLPEVKDVTGLSRSSIYKGMDNGTFPPSVQLVGRVIGWSQSSIEAFIASRLAKRRAVNPMAAVPEKRKRREPVLA